MIDFASEQQWRGMQKHERSIATYIALLFKCFPIPQLLGSVAIELWELKRLVYISLGFTPTTVIETSAINFK